MEKELETIFISELIEKLEAVRGEYGEISIVTALTKDGLPSDGLALYGVTRVAVTMNPKNPSQPNTCVLVTVEGNRGKINKVHAVFQAEGE